MRGLLGTLSHILFPEGSGRKRLARRVLRPLLEGRRARPEPYVTTVLAPAQRMRVLPPSPRILLLKLDHIGDFLLSLGAFETLRQAFADAEITLVCGPWARPWSESLGFFDRIVPVESLPARGAEGEDAAGALARAYDALKLGKFDLAVDLRHDPDTRALLARTEATFRAGYYAPPAQGGAVLDIALPLAERAFPEAGACRPLHAGLRVAALAAVVAASFARRNETLAHRLRRGEAPEEIAAPYAVIAPGAGITIREWPHERLIAVARMLQRDFGLQIVIAGAAADAEAGRKIAAALTDTTLGGTPPAGTAVTDLTGRLPLSQLPELFARARIFVGNDTGTTHLAASLGTPTVAIMSGLPTPEVWVPVGAAVHVIAGQARCAPCHIMRPEDCPFDIACLKEVKIQDVESACRDLLEKRNSRGNW